MILCLGKLLKVFGIGRSGMRAVIQRVKYARVRVEGQIVGEIAQGMLVLVGIGKGDGENLVQPLAQKIALLRIFSDAHGKMNLSLLDIKGGALVVSQFTLFADCTRGRRPFFGDAGEPVSAQTLCEAFITALRATGIAPVATGRFGADMQVELCNDGPVTILLESK
jgi:D-aminoacyl-tRNA deacylase